MNNSFTKFHSSCLDDVFGSRGVLYCIELYLRIKTKMSILFLSSDLSENSLLPALTNCEASIIAQLKSAILDIEAKAVYKAIIFDSSAELSELDVRCYRDRYPTSFIVFYDPPSSSDPHKRLNYFDWGVNMVAHDVVSIISILSDVVLPAGRNGGTLSCPDCGMSNLSSYDLWLHLPAFHINTPNETYARKCPICDKLARKPLIVHIHDNHSPHPSASHSKPVFYGFSLVVCRHPATGLYLLCQEFSNQGFWVPGGAVDAGESFATAAIRETQEEAGIDITLKGILSVEHEPHDGYVRMRVVFYAEPVDPQQLPKSIPNFESAGACWCSLEDIQSGLRLRGREPKQWSRLVFFCPPPPPPPPHIAILYIIYYICIRYLAQGGEIFPLSILHES
jgi:8-oxo-dGTP pyrophosphatase MutT (NUDIX family)